MTCINYTQKQLAIDYSIFDSLPMPNTISELFIKRKIVISVIFHCSKQLLHPALLAKYMLPRSSTRFTAIIDLVQYHSYVLLVAAATDLYVMLNGGILGPVTYAYIWITCHGHKAAVYFAGSWQSAWFLAVNHHIEAETKWPPFSRRHFQMHFLE